MMWGDSLEYLEVVMKLKTGLINQSNFNVMEAAEIGMSKLFSRIGV